MEDDEGNVYVLQVRRGGGAPLQRGRPFQPNKPRAPITGGARRYFPRATGTNLPAASQATTTPEGVNYSGPSYDFTSDEVGHLYEEGYELEGGVLVISNGEGRRPSYFSPAKLNVVTNECMRCGLPGHRAFGALAAKCPLKDVPMTSTPCPACGKGGHLASNCPKNA